MSSQPSAAPDDPGEEPSYEVGYGKPPRATRFQPRRSIKIKGGETLVEFYPRIYSIFPKYCG